MEARKLELNKETVLVRAQASYASNQLYVVTNHLQSAEAKMAQLVNENISLVASNARLKADLEVQANYLWKWEHTAMDQTGKREAFERESTMLKNLVNEYQRCFGLLGRDLSGVYSAASDMESDLRRVLAGKPDESPEARATHARLPITRAREFQSRLERLCAFGTNHNSALEFARTIRPVE